MQRLSLSLALLLVSGPTLAEPWVVPPPSYTYAANIRCSDPVLATLRPNEARYDICADQMALFKQALADARGAKRLLIVDFGATWCPWCRSLQAQWPTPALLGHKTSTLDYGAAFQVVKIGISTLHAGRQVDVASGHAVLDNVLAATKGAKLKSVPFLAVIDPDDRTKTVARGLDDFENPGAGAHAPSLIRGYLAQAHAHLRNGAAAPTEPGWLRRKVTRLWMRLFGD
jgi:thiol-disulfide isomerase/thioredoxin